MAASNYGDTVNAFYLAYYGRPADPAGLAFWTAALQKSNGDINAIVNAFANSPEATARFASVSVTERVTDIYQQLFNRAPDKAGLAFWVEAIESGRLSMANAALEIMHAAQSTDIQISAARQQVAAQFTAEVEKSGIPYDGVAAVQAARVLISAVTADSKPADIDALIKAGSSLVQTAHDNPAVIAALANGGDLSKVLSTAGGQADPVGLVQALASIGKAAVTDSAGLDALLKGGGVSGLLNSLPAGTSLKDVAAAVNQGGLSAGVEAAKPAPAVPADTTPPAALSVQLVEDTGLSATDHITSKGSFQIGGVESGAAWQYSLDGGKTWATGPAADDKGTAILDTSANGEQTLQVRAVDAAGNIGAATSFAYTLRTSLAPTMIFVVDGKELPALDTLSVNSTDYLVHIYGTTKGTGFYFEVSDSGKDGSWTMIKDTDPLSEGIHYIRYVATDLAGNIAATNPLKLVMDLTAPAAPKVALVNDTGVSATDHFTSDGHIQVSGIEAQGSWEYSFDGKTWTAGPAANADGVALIATTSNGAQTLQVRSHDLARNTSEVVKFDYTLQTSFKPTLAFRDGANGADLPGATLATNTDDFWITLHGGADAAKVVFQTSDTGADGSWQDADMAAPLSEGTHYIRDIVTDRAGNTSATNALRVDMDKTAPNAPTVELVNDTGASATDRITTDGRIKVSGLEAAGSWEYSFDGKTWSTGPAANAEGVAVLATTSGGPQTLQVRSHDLAHNTSEVVKFGYTLFAPTLAIRDNATGTDLPGDTLLTNTDNYWVTLHGGLNAAKVVFQLSDSGKDGTWTDALDTDPLSDGSHFIRYVVTEQGGNTVATNALRIDMDKTAPAAPTVALAVDSGISATDKITNNTAIKISGLEASASWEFSYDKGATWKPGLGSVVDGTANLDTGALGAQTLMVRSTDKAGNLGAATTLEYTAQKFLAGLLNVGKPGSEVTLNSKSLNPSVMIAGLSAGTTKIYQVSTTGKADDFHDWHADDVMADGTYYFRATGSDVAGNSYVTSTVTVHLDNTPPPAPAAVKLVQDTGVDGDGITTNGSFVVSGLEQGAAWQFSSDGKTWYQGAPAGADGTAAGYVQATGEQILQVRTVDLVGNTSAPVSLHLNMDNHLPALGITLNGADPVTHLLTTSASSPVLVFSYTGTINEGDTFDFTPMFQGDNDSSWIKIDSSMIDTVNKTITLTNLDLSHGDFFLTLRGTNPAGHIYYQATVDGPYTSYWTQYPASGPKFLLSGQSSANLYLTDGSNAPVKVTTVDASGGLVGGQSVAVGAQATAVQGVLGAGNDALAQTVNDKGSYAFGTTGGDTLSGNYVWGFGGDDVITATGSASYNSALISGGAGADTIHTETSSSGLSYASSAESFLVADDAVAHGFDTVYLSNGGSTSYSDVLNFEDIKLGDFYHLTGAANFSGSETGNTLLAALEKAVTGSFHTGETDVQAALVDFGVDGDGHKVNFLVVDADKDGHVGSGDYVVKLVGAIGTIGASYEGGMFFINTLVTH